MSFFQDHLGSFKTIRYIVYSQHNGRTAHFPAAYIPLALRGPADGLQGVAESRHPHPRSVQYPPRQMVCKHHWFSGHWGIQEMDTSRHLQRCWGKENTGKHLPSLCKHLRSFNIQWNYIDEMYSDIQQGEQETTDQLDQRIKILVEKCSYQTNEEKERCRLELLFHATKYFEVKKWVRSQTALKETVTFEKTIAACKTTWSNHQGLPSTQVQWRSCNIYHHQWDQNLHKKGPRISSQSPYQE